MTTIQVTGDERDLLIEIFNVAMGRAGSDLAILLKSFVDLSVPELNIVSAEKIAESVLHNSSFSEDEMIIAFKQGFSAVTLQGGEAMVVFDMDTRSRMAEILGLSNQVEALEEIALMYEMCNLLVGACLNSVSEQLFGQTASFSQPKLIAEGRELRKIVYENFMRSNLQWEYTMLVKISFLLQEKTFRCDLLMFLSEQAIAAVKESVSRMLAESLG